MHAPMAASRMASAWTTCVCAIPDSLALTAPFAGALTDVVTVACVWMASASALQNYLETIAALLSAWTIVMTTACVFMARAGVSQVLEGFHATPVLALTTVGKLDGATTELVCATLNTLVTRASLTTKTLTSL